MSAFKITTERLELRFINLQDLESIHELHSLPETDEFNALGIPINILETEKIIDSYINANQTNPITQYTFIIETASKKSFIGLFGLKLGNKKYKRGEVWFKLHPNHWRRGYATEALEAILDFAFDTPSLHRIEAGCAVKNIASKKVLEKTGFIKEGRGRQVLPLKSGWSDCFEFSILETDKRK